MFLGDQSCFIYFISWNIFLILCFIFEKSIKIKTDFVILKAKWKWNWILFRVVYIFRSFFLFKHSEGEFNSVGVNRFLRKKNEIRISIQWEFFNTFARYHRIIKRAKLFTPSTLIWQDSTFLLLFSKLGLVCHKATNTRYCSKPSLKIITSSEDTSTNWTIFLFHPQLFV